MSSVVSLEARRNERGAYKGEYPFPTASDLYFNVHEYDMALMPKKLSIGQSHEFPIVDSHKALVRNINDKPVPIAVVGRNYNVVQNRQLFEAIEHQFMRELTPKEISGCQVKDSQSYLGQTCIREYIFPNVRCDLGQNTRSDVAFRTVVVNGFGGSSFKLMAGAIDFFCTNGMVVGDYDVMYHRHTTGLKIGNVVERLRRGIDVFYKQADVWRKWMHKTIDASTVEEFLKTLPSMSERRAAQLHRQFYIEAQTHGNTVWALYSAMTYFASHNEGLFPVRDTGKDNVAATLLQRSNQVRKWTSSDEWQAIAA